MNLPLPKKKKKKKALSTLSMGMMTGIGGIGTAGITSPTLSPFPLYADPLYFDPQPKVMVRDHPYVHRERERQTRELACGNSSEGPGQGHQWEERDHADSLFRFCWECYRLERNDGSIEDPIWNRFHDPFKEIGVIIRTFITSRADDVVGLTELAKHLGIQLPEFSDLLTVLVLQCRHENFNNSMKNWGEHVGEVLLNAVKADGVPYTTSYDGVRWILFPEPKGETS